MPKDVEYYRAEGDFQTREAVEEYFKETLLPKAIRRMSDLLDSENERVASEKVTEVLEIMRVKKSGGSDGSSPTVNITFSKELIRDAETIVGSIE
uniref:Uncharacterized protein n=1 Tax=viral metagenome TaxID=1070528 RepID=A0A6M3LC57_9ZZZZ